MRRRFGRRRYDVAVAAPAAGRHLRLGQHADRQLARHPGRSKPHACARSGCSHGRWRRPGNACEARCATPSRRCSARVGERRARFSIVVSRSGTWRRCSRCPVRKRLLARTGRARPLSGSVQQQEGRLSAPGGRAPRLGPAFSARIVGAFDAARDKPAPDPVLLALARVGHRRRPGRSGSPATPTSTWNARSTPAASQCWSATRRRWTVSSHPHPPAVHVDGCMTLSKVLRESCNLRCGGGCHGCRYPAGRRDPTRRLAVQELKGVSPETKSGLERNREWTNVH